LKPVSSFFLIQNFSLDSESLFSCKEKDYFLLDLSTFDQFIVSQSFFFFHLFACGVQHVEFFVYPDD